MKRRPVPLAASDRAALEAQLAPTPAPPPRYRTTEATWPELVAAALADAHERVPNSPETDRRNSR
jgi:hypothetical protein